MAMKGKLFRPTLVLLASAVTERSEPRAITLAASSSSCIWRRWFTTTPWITR